MRWQTTALFFGLCFFCGLARANEGLYAEVEVERGPDVSRLTVYIINKLSKPLELHTGSEGGAGQYDDRVTGRFSGTPVVALPEVTFRQGNPSHHWVTSRAPSFGSGMTRRDMDPYVFVVQPDDRKRYYSFQVPTSHIEGKFISGKIVFPEANQFLLPKTRRVAKELTVVITGCIETKPGQKNSEPSAEANGQGGDR